MSSQNKAEEIDVCDTAQEHTSGTSQPVLEEPLICRHLKQLCEDSELEESVSSIGTHADEVSAPPLQDDQMRWLVVGICLHSIISPALRKQIPQTIQGLYARLKRSDNIHTQTFANYLMRYAPTNKDLNYESINNNANIPKIRGKRDIQNYNYMVKDEVDLSKLFLTTPLAHFTAFDDTCDSSALLSIIINVDKFQPALRAVATKIRDEVRNPWAHCKFSEWDIPKLQKSFVLMENIIKFLCLPLQEESRLLLQLKTWNTNALHILHGTIGYGLMKRLNTETSLLARYCRLIKSGADENFTEVLEALNTIDCCFGKLEMRVQELEKENRKIKQDQATSIAALNKFVKIYDGLMSTQEESSRKRYYFCTPLQNKYFVGRKKEIQWLKDNFFGTDKNTCTQAICGLGGIGKTSLANEYAWEYRQQYPGGIYWVLAEDTRSLLESFKRLSTRAGVGNHNLTNILYWLSSRMKRWLLVIDNLDGEQLDSEFSELLFGDWKHDTCGHILITTRREGLSAIEVLKVESFISLDDLSATQALLFMKKRTGYNTNECDDTIESLVSELHGLPLALEQTAAHIKILKCSFKEYLDSFKKKRLKLPKALENDSTYNKSAERLAVETTWNMNFRYVEKCSHREGLGTAAVSVMEIFALLPHIRILPQILNYRRFRGELCVLNDDLKKEHIIEILARFSIVSREDSATLTMHRLVKQTVEENMSEERKYMLLRTVNEAIIIESRKSFSAQDIGRLYCRHYEMNSEKKTAQTKSRDIELEKTKLAYLYHQLMKYFELTEEYKVLFSQDS